MSSKIDEEKLISVLYANFQGNKRKINDWIFLAERIRDLSQHYGSYKELAKNIGVSNELIRESLKLLELPEEVKTLVKEGKLKYEVAWRIASVKDKSNQIKIANLIIGLKTHEARDAVRIFRENPNIDIEGYIDKIKKARMNIEEINVIVLPIRQIDYFKIKNKAKKHNKSIEKFLLEDIIMKSIDDSK